jgi:hypothetical protein
VASARQSRNRSVAMENPQFALFVADNPTNH